MAPKRIFLTGGSGYVGAVALAAGHSVRALSRSERSDAKLQALGAVPVRGDLTTLDVLRAESAAADAVIHLATAYVLGGPGTYDDVLPVDVAALDALAEGLAGTDRPLVTTAGTLLAAADPAGGETDEASPEDASPLNTRGKHEKHALALATEGVKSSGSGGGNGRTVRVSSVRLAPWVYGRGGSGVGLFLNAAAKAGCATTVDGGTNRTTTVHVDDAARLYLLAAGAGERPAAAAGEVFNASGETDVTVGDMFGAMARALGVPLRDVSFEQAAGEMGHMFASFVKAENRASGDKARRVLGWEPRGLGVLDEIAKGSYAAVAEGLRKQAA
ncbi:hypothetical protein PLICBS_009400 [Purpureocillium lilacinum]|uniref:uncharacterized protein n=1 Tax=Purpureocillium lilacinum TaxID=33203 RepID=UPI00208D189A|nr:hypothetical protein PLICBS_009400 [Purpureocillium lilacinum]